jgi:anti-sigma28 factor (negative regulator of flagellin synthesis)
MEEKDQRKDHHFKEKEEETFRKEKIERAKERLRKGFYSSEEVVLFLAERLSMAK